MAAAWLTEALGPSPAPRVVRTTSRPAPTAISGGSSTSQPYDINSLLKGLQGDYDAANTAGLERYGHLMGQVHEVKNQVLGEGGIFDQQKNLMSGYGETASRDIGERETKALAESEQDLVTRGLGNTTIRGTARRGIRADTEKARGALTENIAGMQAGLLGQRAGAEMDIGRFLADARLSRQDIPPDMGMYANLLQSLGSGGAGTSPFSGGSGGAYGGGSYGGGGGGAGGAGSRLGGGGGGGSSGPGTTTIYGLPGGMTAEQAGRMNEAMDETNTGISGVMYQPTKVQGASGRHYSTLAKAVNAGDAPPSYRK